MTKTLVVLSIVFATLISADASPTGISIKYQEDLTDEGIAIAVLDVPPPSGVDKCKYIRIEWTPSENFQPLLEAFENDALGITFDLLRLDDKGKPTALALSWFVPLTKQKKVKTVILYDPAALTELEMRFWGGKHIGSNRSTGGRYSRSSQPT